MGSRGPSPSPSQTPYWLLRVSCLHLIPAEDVAARGLFLRNRTCCSPVQNPSMAAHCLLGTVGSQSEKPNPAVGGFAGLSPESADVWKAVTGGGGGRSGAPRNHCVPITCANCGRIKQQSMVRESHRLEGS